MARLKVQPYKQGSKSAKDISRALGAKRVNLVRTRLRDTSRLTVLNWGSSTRMFNNARYLNEPEAVNVASSKLTSLEVMSESEVPIPRFTTSQREAQEWLNNGSVIMTRRYLRANSGRGLVVVEPGQVLPPAPLYTEYVKKFDEYRIHVFNGEVIHTQQKRRRTTGVSDNEQEINSRVRNHSGGWVFCTGQVTAPERVLSASTAAVQSLGLLFGAVDVGYNRHYNRATVYEVNTAPGLSGPSTREAYARAVRRTCP